MADDAKARVKELLGKTVRVQLTDGRVEQGTLLCVDAQLNIVLGATQETRTIHIPQQPQPKKEHASVGTMVVSRAHYRSVEVLLSS